MSNNLETSIVLKLTGNLDQQAARYSRSIDQMAKSSSRSLNVMRGSVHAMGKGLDAMGNRYTAILSGGTLTAAAMQVANFDAQIVRMGTDVGMTAEQVKNFKSQILSVANAPDIRIGNSELGKSVTELLALTGDLKFADENIRNLGIGIQGFGAEAKDVAGLVGIFHQKEIRDVEGVAAAYDLLYGQFAKGSVPVPEIAKEAPKLFSLTKRTGIEAIAEMGALEQIFMKTTGTAAEATTSIKAAVNAFSDLEKLKILNNEGIKVFEDDGKTLRPLTKLLTEIVNAAEKSDIKLRKVFDDTAMQGMRSLYPEENQRLLDEMAYGTVQLGRTQQAAAENANTFKASLQSLTNAMQQFADKKLSGPLQSTADFINGGGQARQDQVMDDIWNAGMVGAGLYGARKAWNVVPDSFKKKMAMNVGLARIMPTVSTGAFATAGLSSLAQVGAVGAASYFGTGWLMRMTGMDDAFSKSEFGDAYGRGWAKILAALGNADAQSSLDSERNATLTVAFDMNGSPFVKTTDTNGFDVNVEAGGGTW